MTSVLMLMLIRGQYTSRRQLRGGRVFYRTLDGFEHYTGHDPIRFDARI